MKLTTKIAVGCLLVMPALAGCGTVPAGEEVTILYDGSVNASNGTFHMQGDLIAGGGIPDYEVYHDVSVQLYANDGTKLCSTSVGTVRADAGRHNVSVTAAIVPKYAVITSPDFWHGKMVVNYFEREPNGRKYEKRYAPSREELPNTVDNSDSKSCSG